MRQAFSSHTPGQRDEAALLLCAWCSGADVWSRDRGQGETRQPPSAPPWDLALPRAGGMINNSLSGLQSHRAAPGKHLEDPPAAEQPRTVLS